MLAKSRSRLPSLELVDVGNLDENGAILPDDDRRRLYNKGNLLWHTDVSFDENRATYSLLAAHRVPPGGAPTEFADMRAAYDALPASTKEKIATLVVEHSVWVWHSRALAGFSEVTPEERASRRAHCACDPAPVRLSARVAAWRPRRLRQPRHHAPRHAVRRHARAARHAAHHHPRTRGLIRRRAATLVPVAARAASDSTRLGASTRAPLPCRRRPARHAAKPRAALRPRPAAGHEARFLFILSACSTS
jgi:hypothetical protein